jgi:hypothetical protein
MKLPENGSTTRPGHSNSILEFRHCLELILGGVADGRNQPIKPQWLDLVPLLSAARREASAICHFLPIIIAVHPMSVERYVRTGQHLMRLAIGTFPTGFPLRVTRRTSVPGWLAHW